MRKRLLSTTELSAVIRLGPNAFETSNNEVVNISLVALNVALPSAESAFASIDVSMEMTPSVKAIALRQGSFDMLRQSGMKKNPDARITTDAPSTKPLLAEHAICMRGIVTGDIDRWVRKFWEVPVVSAGWRFFQSTPPGTRMGNVDEKRSNLPAFTGRENIIDWSDQGRGMLRPGTKNAAYGRPGVAVGQMGSLPVTIYSGELYDNNTAPIVPRDLGCLPAIWAYCTDRAFFDEVRRIDRKMNVTSATFIKVPFDVAHWKKVAKRQIPAADCQSRFQAIQPNGSLAAIRSIRISLCTWPSRGCSVIGGRARRGHRSGIALPWVQMPSNTLLMTTVSPASLRSRVRSLRLNGCEWCSLPHTARTGVPRNWTSCWPAWTTGESPWKTGYATVSLSNIVRCFTSVRLFGTSGMVGETASVLW